MPHDHTKPFAGTIRHVFAHRFVFQDDQAFHLADLGPKGLEAFPLEVGLPITLEGDRRPSEIKVTRIATPGREAVRIEHKTPNHKSPGHKDADRKGSASQDPGQGAGSLPAPDPAKALAAVQAADWTPSGAPLLKPRHVEILARRQDGPWTELHVGGDGTIHKTKPADPAKWHAART